MSHSDLVSLTFWSSIQLAGSAETRASASDQKKSSTSDRRQRVVFGVEGDEIGDWAYKFQPTECNEMKGSW